MTNYSLLPVNYFIQERAKNTNTMNLVLIRQLCNEYGLLDARKWCFRYNINPTSMSIDGMIV